jgi:hypothetical protein
MNDLYLSDGTAVYVTTRDGRPVYSGVVAGTFEGRYVVRPDSEELEETAVPAFAVVPR